MFWSYQATQEVYVIVGINAGARWWLTSDSFYQDFLGKSLTDKYSHLNTQMDKVVHNANTEIKSLQARISG